MAVHGKMGSHAKHVGILRICTLGLSLALMVAEAARADDGSLRVQRSRVSGLASFVTDPNHGSIPVELPPGRTRPEAEDFLRQYGRLFGVSDVANQLREIKAHTDRLGYVHTTYEQVHAGVPVFSGVLKVHQDSLGDIIAANGDFYTIPPELDVHPTLTPQQATGAARASLGDMSLEVEEHMLVIVDPGWYGDASIGPRLAYHLVLTDWDPPLREAFFIDAQNGEVLDRWSLLQNARLREIYDAEGGSTLPGVLVRAEGDPPVASPEDVNRAYDYLGDTYDYYDRAFGRDGIDDAGMIMSATANYESIDYCPNAWWDVKLKRMVFCSGMVTDDIVAHEATHGITQHTARLIYQNQPGQLNESFSDVFGELIDLFNGDAAFAGPPTGPPYWPTHPTGPGTDTPNNLRTACSSPPDYVDGVRWMIGEDSVMGAIRDMWSPPCEGDPDRAYSLLQKCLVWDNGGVHSGSGIPNHALAMLVDGKTFNGYTVDAIGPIKAGAVWYRALTMYLTPASDFEDAYHCFNQAAQDLIGTYPNDPRTGLPSEDEFTTDDAQQVDTALVAVEMNTEGRCGAVVPEFDPQDPEECPLQEIIYEEDFESGPGGWTMTTTAPPTGDGWVLTDKLPRLREGSAWFYEDVFTGAPLDAAESYLYSPLIDIPADISEPRLSLMQYVGTSQHGESGNIRISVNDGPWTLIPTCLFEHNPPHWISMDGLLCVFNQPTFSGVSGAWFTSVADLRPLVDGGDTIQLMFAFGDRFYSGVEGWYVDDVKLYACACDDATDCDDGLYCNGLDSCVGGHCEHTDPCPGQVCDEAADACLPTAFFEDFENGNWQGWDLRGPGSTAVEGDWVIGDPNGMFYLWHEIQSMSARRGCGCAFTGENPSQYYNGDVDDGVTYLVSPVIDLSSESHAALSFDWWFVAFDPSSEMSPAFTVEASPDDGTIWFPVLSYTEEELDGVWRTSSYRLETIIPLTDQVRIRFGAAEETTTMSDLVEAAVDDVAVALIDLCAVGPEDLDCNGNEVADWCDLEDGTSPDCNGNGVPDECDIGEGTSPDCQPNGVPDECEIISIEWTIEFTMDSDPGWSVEGLWAWGQPQGGGDSAGGFDPHSGYTGVNVYGYNLEGDYEPDLPERHVTTTPIDCSDMEHVHLSFWRWLWVEEPPYDHAGLSVSHNGVDWETVWENTEEVGDWPWQYKEYDISAWADGQSTVYIRWTMGPTDETYDFCGWNIDDVVISGDLSTGAIGDCNANRIPDDCDAISPGDFDADGLVGLADFAALARALAGPGAAPDVQPPECVGAYLTAFDADTDGDVDLADVVVFQQQFAA